MNSLWIPKFLWTLPLLLLACQTPPKVEAQKAPPVHQVTPPPPGPLDDNPFIKKAQPQVVPQTTVQTSSNFQTPGFRQAAQINMNESWTVFIWRDDPNNVTCYLYCIKDSTSNGISCVKN